MASASEEKQEKDANDPSVTSDAYDKMLPVWAKIGTVLKGTEAMRAAGQAYLPQYENESDRRYDVRLKMSTLYNMAAITLDSWVGRPFGAPAKQDKVPAKLEPLLQDVDMEGNELNVFSRSWFKQGLAKAFCHVYVDMPRVDEKEQRTLADDDEIRPYMVLLDPECVFFVDAETTDGRETLREVRMMEQITERDGYLERCVKQIRRVFLRSITEGAVPTVHVEIFRKEKTENGKEQWVVVDRYNVDFDEIPMVTFYAERQYLLYGKPPLEDLVDLNVEHWQSKSDQRNILTAARFPILAVSGGTDDGKKIVIGPYKYLYCPDPAGRFYYVEHNGSAIEAGRTDLLDIEARAAEYGAEFLKKRPGGETATARVLDTAEATSPLQDVTQRFSESLTRALRLMAKWMKLPEELTVELTTQFGPEAEPVALSSLSEARRMRDISRIAYTDELKRYKVLSADYDAEEDATQLEKEAMDMFGTQLPPEDAFDKGGEDDDTEEDEEQGKEKKPPQQAKAA